MKCESCGKHEAFYYVDSWYVSSPPRKLCCVCVDKMITNIGQVIKKTLNIRVMEDGMNRQDAIRIIGDLFPPDAPYEDTAAKGKELLEQAKIITWKNESDAVLFEYATLCMAEDNRQAKNPATGR